MPGRRMRSDRLVVVNLLIVTRDRLPMLLLIDADPQVTALDWSVLRQGEPAFSVIGLPKPTLHREMSSLASGYDHGSSTGRRRSRT